VTTRLQHPLKYIVFVIALGSSLLVLSAGRTVRAEAAPCRPQAESPSGFVTIKSEPVSTIIENARRLSSAEKHEEAIASYNHALDVSRDKTEKKALLKEKKQARAAMQKKEHRLKIAEKKSAAEARKEQAAQQKQELRREREQKLSQQRAVAEAKKTGFS